MNEEYKSGELIVAFPFARHSKMRRVGLLIETTCKRDGDSEGNEWRALLSDGEIWSLCEFQFIRLEFYTNVNIGIASP